MFKYKDYQVVVIKKHLVGVSSWTEPLNLSFIPSDVILISFHKYDNDQDDNILNCDELNFIHTDLIDNQILCQFNKSVIASDILNIPFKLNQAINGNFNFYLKNIDGNDPGNVNTIDLYLSFTLLFIQFKAI